ncbi:HK97-gp10 family putative phage morphogenesis protein [Enterococcus faecium]|uniref:HK97-gp10 family putative phage morphogenesis protein n=1 Tax=Enterococcus faecium TaxID=1352 RepID=UPI00226EA22A|nr:HK97-gp10 family putative phage morphogenesis protein [Enterococcus faecium]
MKAHLEFKGIDQLMKHLEKAVTLEDVKQVVKKNGAELNKVMQEKAQFKGHWEGDVFVSPTGFTKRSIRLWLHESGFTAQVGPQSEYSPYLEYGTRFMSAQPFVGPAFNYQKVKFMAEMKALVK